MRILVVSDIHANLAALEAVLEKTQGDRDEIVCLGDLVGYGPDPRECIARVKEVCALILGGNHDLAAGGAIGLANFADHSRAAIEWTIPRLSPEDREYLSKLPLKTGYRDLLLSHGNPRDPLWGYIFSQYDAETAFSFMESSAVICCFFGHTHVPSFFLESREQGSCLVGYGEPDLIIETHGTSSAASRGEKPQGELREEGPLRELHRNNRVLLNPGSVGFPRNEPDAYSPRRGRYGAARYALFDTESGIWQFKRIEYDMQDTAKRMKQQGLR
ncbi:metallophosphoesterase [Treponema primitia ZAS-2]|uniref:Metallophosphoesterase n=1 Tax=Treponema primitia (strain ATCC BAA-887 / DSM 12427 / ZAS-2) TaxID=545694 RepID=F5YND2_TREPZ|nr:metallophosphoesterase family protein [Treponema primitia]AEF85924.1 metallophosphoesterase [Treponema primitia ZAS-2]